MASTAAVDQGLLSSVFSEPETWKPERWLDATEDMHLNWFPFGYGSRSCPGSNLAITELKYIIGTVFRLFRVENPKHHTQERLDLADVCICLRGQEWALLVEVCRGIDTVVSQECSEPIRFVDLASIVGT